jgi:pimeloyl-ACP methyl ester carboxylesterase
MSESLTLHYAEAADGVQLSYYTVGSGPSILIIHGSACYALSHQELAIALSSSYTVHLASRRCRGLSGPYPESIFEDGIVRTEAEQAIHKIHIADQEFPEAYQSSFKSSLLATEIADLGSLIAASGAEYLICVSSGALVALHALLHAEVVPALQRIRKIILFEPPLICTDVATSLDISGILRYESDLLLKGEVAALVTAMYTVELGLTWMPRRLMEWLTWLGIRLGDGAEKRRKASGGEDQGNCTLKDMARLIRYDFAVVEGMMLSTRVFEAVGGRGEGVLLLQGSKTSKYLAEATEALAKVISTAQHIKVAGVGHELLVNGDMRGQPAKAVPYISAFFA